MIFFSCPREIRHDKKCALPKIGKICEVEFCEGSRKMYYKEDFDGLFVEADFLRSSFQLVPPQSVQEERGTSTAKKAAILKLISSYRGRVPMMER